MLATLIADLFDSSSPCLTPTGKSPNNRASLHEENRLSSIKQVLQTNSKDIEEHIRDANEMKRALGIWRWK